MPVQRDGEVKPGLELSVCDRLLTTTRSVRKRLDLGRPVPADLIEECLEIAVQAPTGTNTQRWRFVVVTDAAVRAKLAEIYKESFNKYWAEAKEPEYGVAGPGAAETVRMTESARYLVDHLQDVPVHVLFCVEERPNPESLFEVATSFGTIMPAAWSFMLAARARGLGCCWTTVHLLNADKAARVLGLPATITQAVLLPVAHFVGETFRSAPRIPARKLTWWNKWGLRRN